MMLQAHAHAQYAQHAHQSNLTDTIISSISNALIHGAVYKMFHNVSMQTAIIIAVLGVGALWFFFRNR